MNKLKNKKIYPEEQLTHMLWLLTFFIIWFDYVLHYYSKIELLLALQVPFIRLKPALQESMIIKLKEKS